MRSSKNGASKTFHTCPRLIDNSPKMQADPNRCFPFRHLMNPYVHMFHSLAVCFGFLILFAQLQGPRVWGTLCMDLPIVLGTEIPPFLSDWTADGSESWSVVLQLCNQLEFWSFHLIEPAQSIPFWQTSWHSQLSRFRYVSAIGFWSVLHCLTTRGSDAST